jgi:enhancer of polycomb-like protein
VDSDDTATEQTYIRPAVFHPRFSANKLSVIPPLRIKRERELKRRPQQNGCVFKRVGCLSLLLLSFSYRSLSKKREEKTVLNTCFMLTPLA